MTDIYNAFKTMEEFSKEVENDKSLQEKLQGIINKNSKLINETMSFNVRSSEDMEEADEVLKSEEEAVFEVIDPNKESENPEERAKPGDALLFCKNCNSPLVCPIDKLVKSEEEENLYNVGEACAHCGASTGYEYRYQLAEVGTTEKREAELNGENSTETKVEEKDVVETPIENKEENTDIILPGENIDLGEDFNTKDFDELIKEHLTKVYENITDYETSDIREYKDGILIEGIVSSSKKSIKTSFIFESITKGEDGKIILEGYNKDFCQGKEGFSIIGEVKNNSFLCESLKTDYLVNNKGTIYHIED